MQFSTKTRLLAAALASSLLGASGSTPDGGRIVNGLNTQDFPTTGALLYSLGGAITANNASSWCSGTLIGCQTFLTAAHCVEDTVASRYWVYLQHSGIQTVSSIDVHPSYIGNSGRDVAIVHLSSPVTGIEPTVFNETHDLDAMGVGLDGTIAGFGQTSGTGDDYGVKRYGDVVTANCNTGATGGEGNDKLVCWDFENPVGPAGDDSNTCNGDSGGPLFMDFAGTFEVVGVTSAGSLESCLAGDHSWDASVYYNRTWIDGQLGADSTSTCGGIPPVGDVDVTVHKNAGSLSTVNPSDGFSVVLTGTPSLVRFTLNGTDNGTFDPDFYVKEGSGASTVDFDCKADGNSVFGACEFASPAAGTWSIHVQQVSGGGEYQVTTTVFGGDPPVCGNDVQENGEECDGTDDDACPGLCTGGCACPAPVCGNNVQESGEECDGTDDAACPGQCNGSCACPAPVCGNNVQESGEECDGTDDGACPGECQGDCSCLEPCTTGPLYGLKLRSNEKRVVYKGWLFDDFGFYAALDPTAADFSLEVADGGDSIDLAIPQAHLGWIKADPVRRKYVFKGDGSLGGLRRVVLRYRDRDVNSLWKIVMRGKFVPGSASINEDNILDYTFNIDNTCHLETW